MKIIVCDNYDEMSKAAAKIVAEQVKTNPNSVLGLATGSTPIGMYGELAEMNKRGEIDLKQSARLTLTNIIRLRRIMTKVIVIL